MGCAAAMLAAIAVCSREAGAPVDDADALQPQETWGGSEWVPFARRETFGEARPVGAWPTPWDHLDVRRAQSPVLERLATELMPPWERVAPPPANHAHFRCSVDFATWTPWRCDLLQAAQQLEAALDDDFLASVVDAVTASMVAVRWEIDAPEGATINEVRFVNDGVEFARLVNRANVRGATVVVHADRARRGWRAPTQADAAAAASASPPSDLSAALPA
jgi:hypothetical protein